MTKTNQEIFTDVQNEGSRAVTREIEYYNLDAILSVGYRSSSMVKPLIRYSLNLSVAQIRK
jgi:hypothetical protein